MKLIFYVLISYLIGSIPTGYIVGKLKGIDIRKYGSGNIGATNVFRVLGKSYGIFVLIFDFLKGFFPLFIFSKTLGSSLGQILIGLSLILGHSFSLYLKFKGGKSVATASGVFFFLVPKAMIFCLILWIIITFITKYVSLASMISALFLPIFYFLFEEKDIYILSFCILTAVIIIIRHKSNILRLIQGKENKISI